MTKHSQTTVLISEPSKMHCEIVQKAFHVVRQRIQVVACVCTSAEILRALQECRPQVAVISADLQDGLLAGMHILAANRPIYPNTKMLVTMGTSDRELVVEAFRLGANGVVSRNSPFDLLCKAIEVVAQGQIWANAQELQYVMEAFSKTLKHQSVSPAVEKRITKCEAAVVRLAVEGLSNREIAQELGLTQHTVKNYLFRVFDKLGVSNRVELVLYCMRQEGATGEEFPAFEKAPPKKIAAIEKAANAAG